MRQGVQCVMPVVQCVLQVVHCVVQVVYRMLQVVQFYEIGAVCDASGALDAACIALCASIVH